MLLVREVPVDARWMRHLRRTLSGNAITQFTEIWTLLEHIQPNADVPDLVTWKWTDGGLASKVQPAAVFRPGREIGFQIFSWLAVSGKCLTVDNPLKQGCTCNPICSLYRIMPEASVHLLVEFSFIRAL
jgi:hypothetical protein